MSLADALKLWGEMSPSDRNLFLKSNENDPTIQAAYNTVRSKEKDKLYKDISGGNQANTQLNQQLTEANQRIQQLESGYTTVQSTFEQRLSEYDRKTELAIQKAEAKFLRSEALRIHKVPEEMAPYVQGMTEEELNASAQQAIAIYEKIGGGFENQFKTKYNINEEALAAQQAAAAAAQAGYVANPQAQLPGQPQGEANPEVDPYLDPMAAQNRAAFNNVGTVGAGIPGAAAGAPGTTTEFTAEQIGRMDAAEYARNREAINQQRKNRMGSEPLLTAH